MRSFLETYNDISLRTNSDTQLLKLQDIEHSGADFYCTLTVESNNFSASSHFQFNEEYLLAFLKDLREMETSLKGNATLKNYFDKNLDWLSFPL